MMWLFYGYLVGALITGLGTAVIGVGILANSHAKFEWRELPETLGVVALFTVLWPVVWFDILRGAAE